MRILGFDIIRAPREEKQVGTYVPGDRGHWWHPVVHEPFTGAWQRNMEMRPETLFAFHAIYSCITLIASDVAKCRVRLVEETEPDVWEEVRDVNSPFLPVLRKPNDYQTRIQFYECWIISKLTFGNTYILKERDKRNVVTRLFPLDPTRVRPLVSEDGSIFYQLHQDNLSGLSAEDFDGRDNLIVPASEIIHDMTTLRHHPLCGIPPMSPAALAARHGLNIQQASITVFKNDARPSGFLTAPGKISQDTADRLKNYWEQKFQGENRGRLAVMGDGIEWKAMSQNAHDAQLVEQLGITGKMVCSSFNVPPYKVQVTDPPSYNNIGALNTQYYTDCIQKFMESIELLLDEGLGLTRQGDRKIGTEFETSSLLRMDQSTLIKSMSDGVRGGFVSPNEARRMLGYPKVKGGESPYLQHQDYSLEALAKRDQKEDPFASAAPPAASANENNDRRPPEDEIDDGEGSDDDEQAVRAFVSMQLHGLEFDSLFKSVEQELDHR